MNTKVQYKEEAIRLRRKGLTYREILTKVPVSKSTISLWLSEMSLTETEKKILKERKQKDISRWRLRAAASLRKRREERDKLLFVEAQKQFTQYIKDPLFNLGLSLYWAEGAKRSSTFAFINSDPEMIKLMLIWIKRYLLVQDEEIRLRLYTHKTFAHENQEKLWSVTCGVPLSRFAKTIYKSQGLGVKKRPNYVGCLRIELGKVKHLRKVLYWQRMLIEHYKKQGNL